MQHCRRTTETGRREERMPIRHQMPKKGGLDLREPRSRRTIVEKQGLSFIPKGGVEPQVPGQNPRIPRADPTPNMEGASKTRPMAIREGASPMETLPEERQVKPEEREISEIADPLPNNDSRHRSTARSKKPRRLNDEKTTVKEDRRTESGRTRACSTKCTLHSSARYG